MFQHPHGNKSFIKLILVFILILILDVALECDTPINLIQIQSIDLNQSSISTWLESDASNAHPPWRSLASLDAALAASTASRTLSCTWYKVQGLGLRIEGLGFRPSRRLNSLQNPELHLVQGQGLRF